MSTMSVRVIPFSFFLFVSFSGVPSANLFMWTLVLSLVLLPFQCSKGRLNLQMQKTFLISFLVLVEATVSVPEHKQVELVCSSLCRAMGLKSQAKRGAPSNTVIHASQEEELVGIGQDIHIGEVSNCQYKMSLMVFERPHEKKIPALFND